MRGKTRVSIEPGDSIDIPVGDFRAEGEGGVRVCGVVIVGVRVFRSELGEEAVGFVEEVLANGVGVGGEAEVDADVAAEDDDGDEAAEDGGLDAVEGLADLVAAREAQGGSSSRASATSAGLFLTHHSTKTHTHTVSVNIFYVYIYIYVCILFCVGRSEKKRGMKKP